MAGFLKGAYKAGMAADAEKKAYKKDAEGKKARMALMAAGKSMPSMPKPMNRAAMRGYGGAK